MERGELIMDYAEQRRQYVSQIRDSFEQGRKDAPEETEKWAAFWMRLRFAAALCLFFLFFCWQSSGITILGYDAGKIIDMIADNRYDKFLQDSDMISNWNVPDFDIAEIFDVE